MPATESIESAPWKTLSVTRTNGEPSIVTSSVISERSMMTESRGWTSTRSPS